MTETGLTLLVLGSIALALINAIRAAYWKAKCETLDEERTSKGWQEECRFLRRLVNAEAAEAVEQE